MTLFRPLAQELARPRAEAAAMTQSVVGDVYDFSGFAPIIDPGEAVVDVNFPVRFFEKPVFTHGFEFNENKQYFFGNIPTYSALVVEWIFGRREETGGAFYDGARIVVVLFGEPQTEGYIHYRFCGKALTGEAGQSTHPVAGG